MQWWLIIGHSVTTGITKDMTHNSPIPNNTTYHGNHGKLQYEQAHTLYILHCVPSVPLFHVETVATFNICSTVLASPLRVLCRICTR